MPPFDLNGMSDEQQLGLVEARQAYTSAGGVLDEFAVPFLVRFLIKHDWTLPKAIKQLKATAKWRAESGADGIRANMRTGVLRFVDFPHALAMTRCVWFLPLHGRSFNGDLVSYQFVGSLDLTTWFKEMSDAVRAARRAPPHRQSAACTVRVPPP
jgi:hypothetical protein